MATCSTWRGKVAGYDSRWRLSGNCALRGCFRVRPRAHSQRAVERKPVASAHADCAEARRRGLGASAAAQLSYLLSLGGRGHAVQRTHATCGVRFGAGAPAHAQSQLRAARAGSQRRSTLARGVRRCSLQPRAWGQGVTRVVRDTRARTTCQTHGIRRIRTLRGGTGRFSAPYTAPRGHRIPSMSGLPRSTPLER